MANADNEVTNRGCCKYENGRVIVQLTPEELGELAEELANESDPARARTLKERIMAGFYGNEVHA